MTPNKRQRPRLTEELERCVAAAKGFAAKEGADPELDSLHLVAAAIHLAPEAAQAALERAAYPWDTAQNLCPKVDPTAAADIAAKPMGLVNELWKVMYGRVDAGEDAAEALLDTERCLDLILRNPSPRLQEFLGLVSGKPGGTKRPGRKGQEVYRSFRDYLASRRQVWTFRFAAWGRLEESICDLGQTRRSQPLPPKVGRLLDEVARAEESAARRCHASSPSVVPLRCLAERHDLTSLQTELLEAALLHELYGGPGSPWSPLILRDLAQALAPETYPANCCEVICAAQGLAEHGLVELGEADGPARALTCSVRLTSCVQEDLLARLDRDTICDSDLDAARRRLAATPTWPL